MKLSIYVCSLAPERNKQAENIQENSPMLTVLSMQSRIVACFCHYHTPLHLLARIHSPLSSWTAQTTLHLHLQQPFDLAVNFNKSTGPSTIRAPISQAEQFYQGWPSSRVSLGRTSLGRSLGLHGVPKCQVKTQTFIFCPYPCWFQGFGFQTLKYWVFA